jgi:hypothetical protein
VSITYVAAASEIDPPAVTSATPLSLARTNNFAPKIGAFRQQRVSQHLTYRQAGAFRPAHRPRSRIYIILHTTSGNTTGPLNSPRPDLLNNQNSSFGDDHRQSNIVWFIIPHFSLVSCRWSRISWICNYMSLVSLFYSLFNLCVCNYCIPFGSSQTPRFSEVLGGCNMNTSSGHRRHSEQF